MEKQKHAGSSVIGFRLSGLGDCLGFKFWLCAGFVFWPSHSTSLSLGLPICQMGRLIVPNAYVGVKG